MLGHQPARRPQRPGRAARAEGRGAADARAGGLDVPGGPVRHPRAACRRLRLRQQGRRPGAAGHRDPITFITFFIGIAAAYWMLGYRGKAKSLIEGIFVAPLILPPTVVGFLLLVFFGKNGPAGKLMQSFDFTIVFTWYGAAIAATVVAFPLMYKTALGAFEQIDGNLLRVARTLGATELQFFGASVYP